MLRTAASSGRQALVVEMTDGTRAANADFRRGVGFYYDLVKANVSRIVTGLAAELEEHPVTTVGVTPGWLRSGGDAGALRGHRGDLARRLHEDPAGFAISESPAYVARGVAALAGDPVRPTLGR